MADPLTYANSDEYVLVNPSDPKVGHLIYDAPMVDAETKQFIRDPETGKIKVYRMVIWGTKGLTQAQVEALITQKNATLVTRINNLDSTLTNFLDADDTSLDQLSELVAAIKANKIDIASLVTDIGKLIDPVSHLPIEATTAAAGVVQLATTADIENGTAGKVVDAKKLIDTLTNVIHDGSISSFSSLALKIYPVGSIYISANSVSPETLFGGTWKALDQGRVLIGANSTYEAGATGGEFTHTITADEMPSHTHTGTTGNESAGHTHSGSTGWQSADHVHGFSGTTSYSGDHGHSAWTDSQGLHRHSSGIGYHQLPDGGGSRYCLANNSIPEDGYSENVTSDAGSHGHNVGIGSAGNHAHEYSGTTGGVSANHYHDFTTGGVSANHTHSFTTGASGSGSAMNNMQPYLAVYMWQRTA